MNIITKPIVEEIISAFIGENQKHLSEIDQESEGYRRAKKAESLFTWGVGYLKSEVFPSLHIQRLMSFTWDVIGNKHVNLGVGPRVPTLSVAILVNRQTAVFVPHNWIEMVNEDPIMQLGAIVFVGSQAVDAYNGRALIDPDKIMPRARAYESEFLLYLRNFKPNEYQRGVLGDFPNGLNSLDSGVLYPYKEVALLS